MEPVRLGLVAIWSLVMLTAGWKAWRLQAPRWYFCAALAGMLASIALWRWHVRLLRFGQRTLRDLGVYESRMVVKVAIVVLLVFGTVVFLRFAGGWLRRALGGTGAALVPTVAAAVFLALLTLSLDDFMPRLVSAPPGRFVIEYALALAALLGAGWKRGES
ncbi:MAG: hypothetical protein GY711_08985 [bacterium]|nr:hypothetical protein [bacterium]